MPEPAVPRPDPGPAITRPRLAADGPAPPMPAEVTKAPNRTVPLKPSVPAMRPEITTAHAGARGWRAPHGDVAAAQDDAPGAPPYVVPARGRPARSHHGAPRATLPVHPHVTGSAVTNSAAPKASLRLPSRTDRGGYIIATLRGELGLASAPALREQLLSLLRDTSHLIIDLSAVGHADASGLAVLVGSSRHARLLGGSLRLAAPSPEVSRVLSATGMNHHLDIFPTVPAAITGQQGLRDSIVAPVTVPARGHRIDGVIAGGAPRSAMPAIDLALPGQART